jgi:hypothetical protein
MQAAEISSGVEQRLASGISNNQEGFQRIQATRHRIYDGRLSGGYPGVF